MSTFSEQLSARQSEFTIDIPTCDEAGLADWIEQELLDNPALASELVGFTSRVVGLCIGTMQVNFQVSYNPEPIQEPVFLCRDIFEIITAESAALRMHLTNTIIVLDNRHGAVESEKLMHWVDTAMEYVGEELQIHQCESRRIAITNFFNGRLQIVRLHHKFFDASKEIRILSCILGEEAERIRKLSNNNVDTIVNQVLVWLLRNVTYKDRHLLSDHSAVGLLRNGTAVCQGISAFAYQLLLFCGVDARYVSGEGLGADGWGPHGWNQVLYRNSWRHMDFTFAMEGDRLFLPERVFRKKHRWDDARYEPKQSTVIVNAKKALRGSILTFLPDSPCFSINGCIVDTRYSHTACLSKRGVILVSLEAAVTLIGGSWQCSTGELRVYLGTAIYHFPSSLLVRLSGSYYIDVIILRRMEYTVSVEGNSVTIRRNSCS